MELNTLIVGPTLIDPDQLFGGLLIIRHDDLKLR
jgi:hypothetical protein